MKERREEEIKKLNILQQDKVKEKRKKKKSVEINDGL